MTSLIQIGRPDKRHGWLFERDSLAKACGITPGALDLLRSRHGEELTEGKHWVTGGESILWTKKGVVGLGFVVRSKEGEAFRDLAEDIIIRSFEAGTPSAILDMVRETVAKRKAKR